MLVLTFMVPSLGRARRALMPLLASGVVLGAADVCALVCNQSAVGNTVLLGCARQQTACIVPSHTIEGDCALDYEGRPVTFRGTLDFGDGRVEVLAGRVTVEGTLLGRSTAGTRRGGRLTLTATAGTILVENKIDVSGDGAGTIALRAPQGSVIVTDALIANGRDDESPNAADGGVVALEAAGAITLGGEIQLVGGADAGGGTVSARAGGSITVGRAILATGGASDGGEVTMTAGDDITITGPLDVRSTTLGGSGGSIELVAGVDTLGGTREGGALELQADVTGHGSSEGSGEDATGGDGGEVELAAAGPVTVTGRINANGAAPDGAGGSLDIESVDAEPLRLTVLDGDLALRGGVALRGAAAADGGRVTLRAGRDLDVSGSGIDLSGGETGGELEAVAGRDASITVTVDASARRPEGDGGGIDIRAGLEAVGTLSVAARLNGDGASDGRGGALTLAGCHLKAAGTVAASAEPGINTFTGTIDLAASRALTLGAGGRYLAGPSGVVVLTRPAWVVPAVAGAVFAPARTDVVTASSVLFPACPACGDGLRQPDEICDPGAGADGACCNSSCTALVCATPTPTPTATRSSTPTPTPAASPTPTGTADPHATATPSVTGVPAVTQTPSATPVVPPTATATPAPPASATATAAGPTPTPAPSPTAVLGPFGGAEAVRCERALMRAVTKLALADLSVWQACALEAFACVQQAPEGGVRANCVARATSRCTRRQDNVERARSELVARFASSCAAVPLPTLLAADGLGFDALAASCTDDIGLVLTSPEAVAACVELSTMCLSEATVATGVPRSGDLLRLLVDVDALGLCLPPATGELGGLGAGAAAAAQRCQGALAQQGRRVFAHALRTLRGCADAAFRCRVAGKSAAVCAGRIKHCRRRLAALPDLRVRALARVERRCGNLDETLLAAAAGLGLGTTGAACLAQPSAHEGLRCALGRDACAAAGVARLALPGLDAELARHGLDVHDAVCTD